MQLFLQVHDRNVPSGFNATLWRGLIPQARATWKDAIYNSGSGPFFISTETRWDSDGNPHPSTRAIVHIYFVDTIPGGRGQTRIRPQDITVQRLVTHFEVFLALRDPNTNVPFSTSTLLGVATHELGHAFGIFGGSNGLGGTGHSPSDGDIMFHGSRVTALSASDGLTIRDLYRRNPTLVRFDRNN